MFLRKELPSVAFKVLSCCYRQLWYLCPRNVVFALVDRGTSADEKEEMARKLYFCPKEKGVARKPDFPFVPWSPEGNPPRLASFISSASWGVLVRLKLEGPHVSLSFSSFYFLSSYLFSSLFLCNCSCSSFYS